MKMFFKFVIVAGLVISATDLSAMQVPQNQYQVNQFVMDGSTNTGFVWAHTGRTVRDPRALAWIDQHWYDPADGFGRPAAPVIVPPAPAIVPPIAPVPVVPPAPAPAPQPAPPAPAQPAVAKVCAKEFAKWLASLTIVSGMTYVAWSLLYDAARLCKNQQDVACPEFGSGLNTVTCVLFAGCVYVLYKTGKCLGKKRVDAAARGYNNVMQQNNPRARWTNPCCCPCDSCAAINEALD